MCIEKLKVAFTLDVRFVHFPLHPETPDEGRRLEDLFRGRGVDVAASQARLKRLAESEGLAYGDRTMTYNSRLAQELGAWADSTAGDGRSERLHDALFRAYFVDGVNLARPKHLVTLAESVGLDPAAAADVLASRTFRDAVDQDWERSGIWSWLDHYDDIFVYGDRRILTTADELDLDTRTLEPL